MIRVENLSKYYGYNKAVDDLSFEVSKGEILGFLGPNGAGKTTTMKMLTCFLPPSSGKAQIFGFDILEDSMEIRRRIGYLPERTPLYQDLGVREYLDLVARLKGVDRGSLKQSISRSVERCGLEEVTEKKIGTLSKGYQQRVGIAQAVINDPELLILDEPTLGLDPRQIIDIRKLINSLGRERTVILSSHILPEVSQVCNRVIIINKGRLVAVDSPENLRERLRKSSMTNVTVRSEKAPSAINDMISGLEGVLMSKVRGIEGDTISLIVESGTDMEIRDTISETLVKNEVRLLEIYNEELSLEEIFMKLVTKEPK
ncbi:MAG: ATP-binding cassette domain-containing protein [Candidatus Krumholzibacteriota bacterium]|nr:ATP-binding cassette domain-containing protein [Candidatus Krumholzibacteriota bacterium]